MINNPVLPGFNPDPCICRKGEDYYLAVSSFEWMPGIPIYHSRDLKNWELYTHVITDDQTVDLKKLPSAKGIWAPCLTWSEQEDMFYVVYGVMNSMNARYFDVDNYLIKAKDITGGWSSPIYLHSAGFDASLFHDEDGKKWVVSLEWETRDGYEKPGVICLAEYDAGQKKIIGYPERIWNGGTDRGCIEAPHLTKHKGFYYLMCAEGGTGYNHCVTMGRSKNIRGPYEKDPANPVLTSAPGIAWERHDPDHLKVKYFNPELELQKSGHGSYVETQKGEVYLVHLCARPFVPELRCTLGRETAIEKMVWTEDNWLHMAGGTNLPQNKVEEAGPEERKIQPAAEFDGFDGSALGIQYYAPRQMPFRFANVWERPGYVRLYGCESLTSLNRVSFLARKLTSVFTTVTTKMEFSPKVYQHSAGLVMYYDNMNYVFLRKYYSESLQGSALAVVRLENGEKTEYADSKTAVGDQPLYLKLTVCGRRTYFEWSGNDTQYTRIGPEFDTTKFSDEYCKYGEFTGTMAGIACVDSMFHNRYADFDFFEYHADLSRKVDAVL